MRMLQCSTIGGEHRTPLARAGAAPRARAGRQRRASVRASNTDPDPAAGSSPLFTSQFMGVLQTSLARQGPDALTGGPPRSEEPRASATEEVLTVALSQSKTTLQQLVAWRDQIDRQVAVQQKQVDRMEFALNKSRNDAAYMRALKEMLHGDL